MERSFALVEAAVSCGSPTWGTEGAFDALVEAGLPAVFGDARLLPMEKLAPCAAWPDGLRHLDTVMEVCRRLRSNVLDALDRGEYPVVIGGDHSCAMGTLAALGEFYGAENLAVVYVDAHTDINTDQTSESGCIHGMDLAAACGLCCGALTVGRNRVNLLGENLHFIGARSIDPPEWSGRGPICTPPERCGSGGWRPCWARFCPPWRANTSTSALTWTCWTRGSFPPPATTSRRG